jgi:hypothetical protein
MARMHSWRANTYLLGLCVRRQPVRVKAFVVCHGEVCLLQREGQECQGCQQSTKDNTRCELIQGANGGSASVERLRIREYSCGNTL